MNYDDFACIALSCCGSSSEFGQIIPLVLEKIQQVKLNKQLDPPEEDKTATFITFFIPDFLRTLLSCSSYQSADYKQIKIFLHDLLELSTKFLDDSTYKKTIYSIDKLLFTKNSILYKQDDPATMYQTIWTSFIENSKFYFTELIRCIQDSFGQDESIFDFVFESYKLSERAPEFKLCIDISLQSYVNFLFEIDSILLKEPQRLKEFQFKALPLFIELLPDSKSIQALSLLNILTNLLNSTQHKTRQLGADSIAQIAKIPQFTYDISSWARQEKIKKSLLNPVSVSLCNSLYPVIQVCLRNGNIEFELFTEFVNECIKQQISEKIISDFISTYCDNFQLDKQPELLEKIRSVEITENNIEIFAKILSNLQLLKKEAIEILIKWSENKELSKEAQNILLDYIIKNVDKATGSNIPQCAVDYANRLIEEENFNDAFTIYMKLVKNNICSKDVIQEFIKSDGKLRQLGFDLEIQRIGMYEDINLDKYTDRIDDYFWYFVSELVKNSKINIYGEEMSELKQIVKEFDYSKSTPYFVEFLSQLNSDGLKNLFRVVKECEDQEITKIAINKLIKPNQTIVQIIEEQIIKDIDNFNESFIKIIPVVDSFFKDLTNSQKFAKYNIIPHFLRKTIDVTFVCNGEHKEVTIIDDEQASIMKEQASIVFKKKVENYGWDYSDTAKSLGIKEGDEIVFASPYPGVNSAVIAHSVSKFINHGITEKLLDLVNEKSDISKSDMEKIFNLINKLPTSQGIKDALKGKNTTLKLLETAKNVYYIKYIFESIRNLSQKSKDFLLKDDIDILQKITMFLEIPAPAEFKEELISILKQYLLADFVPKSDIQFILLNLIDIFVDETCTDEMRYNIIEIIINLSDGELQPKITEILTQKVTFLDLIMQKLTKDNFEQFKDFVNDCKILEVIFDIVRSQILEDNFNNKFILSLIEEKSEIGKHFTEKEFLNMSINLINLQNPEMVRFGIDFFYKLAEKSEIVNEYVTFLINLILTTDNEENKENIFKMFTKLNEINDVYKTAFVTFVDNLVNLRIERFNYDYHLFSQSSTKSVGLLNLGSTCFFNAVIQQLFHLPCFTYRILTEKFGNDKSMNNLRRMLSELLISKQRYSDPKSFFDEWKGWNSQKINVKEQQDASEFMTIFIDKLPSDISKLFKGSSVWTVRDLEGNILKRIEEDFTTISLQVRSFSNMNSSLNGFIKPGMLTGDNQYETNGQKIDAQHLTRLKKCPPILFFQLRRFEYNTRTGRRDKINDKFDISLRIKIDPLLETNEKQRYYLLNGIIMHSGSADSGHYLSYVKIQNNWIEFNDSEVSFIDEGTVLEKAAAKGTLENCSAYILVYVKEDFVQIDDKDEIVTFNDLQKYIPKEIKEDIYKMNEIFMKTQFAFSKIFLDYMMDDDKSGFDTKLNFFFHIFLHADYKDFPTKFFDKMITQSSSSNSNLKMVILEHTEDIIELYLSLTNNDIVSKLDLFISSMTLQLDDDEKLFEFYQTVVERLEFFVENRMNVKNILKLIYDYSQKQTEKCQVFVDKIQEFIVLNYEKAEQMAHTYKSSLFIGDVFKILSLYLDSVKIEILLKYSDTIILTYSNRHPFYSLLVSLYENDKIDDEFFLETARANASAMFSEFRKKFETMKVQKSTIIVTFYERFHSLRDEILKFLATNNSINFVQSCRMLSKQLISLLFVNKEDDRNSARNIIEIGFPVMKNDDIMENYKENDEFFDFIDGFLKYFVKFINSEETKDEKVMKDVLNYIVILCPFMREEEDLVIVSLIEKSSEQKEIFNYLMFCSQLGSDFAQKHFTEIMEDCLKKIPSFDENKFSDEATSVLAALTCFAMNLDFNSDEIKNFVSKNVIKLFKNVMKIHGKDTSEYLFLETAYNKIENSISV